MSDQEIRIGQEELQFDRVITQSTSSAAPGTLAVICAACRTLIETEYYHINGDVFCSRCRTTVESAAETPRGVMSLLTAGVFGLGAGVIGAAIYYAVLAIAHLEIGIIAILIGYMVGYAVRKGARGRGGRRFQVMAVALTYVAVALAYTPIAVKQTIAADRDARKAPAAPAPLGPLAPLESMTGTHAPAAPDGSRATTTKPGGGGLLLSGAFMLAFVAALPVLMVVGSFPSGLISALIILIGMRQAWKMTGAPWLEILGPYRVGAVPASTPA
jgi:hypothetical protein